jgi:hypothetical protein
MKSMICTRTIACRVVGEVGDKNVILWLLVEEDAWKSREAFVYILQNPKAAIFSAF